MNAKFHIRSISLGILIGIIVVACIGAAQDSESEKTVDAKEKELAKIDNSEYQDLINSNYKIYSLPIPVDANFAGEKVPVNNIMVKEALDNELVRNTYWHSNSMFYIKRANRWFPIIEEILKKNNIPSDFKYLAVIESGLLNVTSPSGAKGYWQFMPKTAKDYGLEVSGDIDERKNIEKSTQAACEYLNNSYKKFGNWTLVAASYNMGKTGVLKQLQKQKVDNYYDLLLNAETGRYVYRIVAVKYLIEHPENYGFNIRAEDKYPPYNTMSVLVDSAVTNWVDFSISQGTSYKVLKTLNPWLISNGLKNESKKSYEILLPIKGEGMDVIGTTDNKFGSNE